MVYMVYIYVYIYGVWYILHMYTIYKKIMKMATLKTSGLQPVAHLTMAYMSQAALLLELWAGVALVILMILMILDQFYNFYDDKYDDDVPGGSLARIVGRGRLDDHGHGHDYDEDKDDNEDDNYNDEKDNDDDDLNFVHHLPKDGIEATIKGP